MKRLAFFILLAAGVVSNAFAQDNEHVQVGVFADYFRLSQTDTNFAGLGARFSRRNVFQRRDASQFSRRVRTDHPFLRHPRKLKKWQQSGLVCCRFKIVKTAPSQSFGYEALFLNRGVNPLGGYEKTVFVKVPGAM